MSELFRFIQTPEIVDIEKYILQKPGMRDSSESNNGLHGSITTNEEEGISTVQFKRIIVIQRFRTQSSSKHVRPFDCV